MCSQLKGLEQENQHLGQTLSALRQRCQVGAEARAKDVEKENRALHQSVCETSAKLNKMESERKQLRESPSSTVGQHVHSHVNRNVICSRGCVLPGVNVQTKPIRWAIDENQNVWLNMQGKSWSW